MVQPHRDSPGTRDITYEENLSQGGRFPVAIKLCFVRLFPFPILSVIGVSIEVSIRWRVHKWRKGSLPWIPTGSRQ